MNSKKFQEIKNWRDKFQQLKEQGVQLYPRQKEEFDRIDFLIKYIEKLEEKND
jgi:sulfur transfer protein SufE